ncbi:MAG: hypothetical protein ACI4E1_07685 [Lachnospira sp.]
MSNNSEEDYLDNLLKSMTETAVDNGINSEEQVEVAVDSEINSKEQAEVAVDESEDVETVLDESLSTHELTPDEVARKAQAEEESLNEVSVDAEAMDKAAEETLEAMLDNVMPDDLSKVDMSSEKEEALDSGLTTEEMDRLMNMNLDNILEDVVAESASIPDFSEDSGNSFNDDNDMSELKSQLDEIFQNDLNTDNSPADDIKTDVDSESAANNYYNANDNDISASEALNMVASANTGNDSSDVNVSVDDGNTNQKKKKRKSKNKSDNLKDKSQKKGALEIIKNIFFEKAESEDNTEDNKEPMSEDSGNISTDEPKDENEQIIAELDKKGIDSGLSEAPNKGFFAKLKYRLQQFKEKQSREEAEEEAAEEQELLEKKKKKEEKKAALAEKQEQDKSDDDSEPKKGKKGKKAKEPKPKKVKKPKEPPKPGDILKIKPLSMVMFVLFVTGVVILIQILNSTIDYNSKVSSAKNYYQSGDYHKAYSELVGLDLNDSDKILFEQTSTIMYVQRQYEAYNNYIKMYDNVSALDSLIKGISRYNKYYDDAVRLGVDDKIDAIYGVIISTLSNTYNISESEALLLCAQSESDFTGYYFKIKAYGEAAQVQ